MMWTLHLPRTILAVAMGCWCLQLTQQCTTTSECDQFCEYFKWANHAVCPRSHLEDIPQVCCGVTTLDVRHNNIRVLRKGVLANFTNLKYLYLDSNNMSAVRKGAFQGCTRLEHLSLGDNDFRSLTRRMMEGLEMVKYLIISRGKLKRIDKGTLQETPSLLTLDLQENQMVSPPCDAIPAGNNLEVLFLSHNRISLFPRLCFQNFTKLKSLQLNDNPIRVITNISAFQGLQSLEELNLRNTSLSAVPVAMFRNIHTATKLIMSQNLIETLQERDFMGLPYLTTLNLEYNRISTIHDKAFSGLDFLKTLVLSNNRIVSVGQDALLPVEGTLSYLHLHGNKLPAIENISSSFLSIDHISIADNSLVCSCHLAPLRQWLQLNRANLSSAEENATCRIPGSRQNVVPILGSDQTYPCLETTTTTILIPEQESTTEFEVSTEGSTPDRNRTVQDISLPHIFLVIFSISSAVIILLMIMLLVVFFKARRRTHLDDTYDTINDSPVDEIMPHLQDSRIPNNPIYSTRIRLQEGQNDGTPYSWANGFRESSFLSSFPSPNSPRCQLASSGCFRIVGHTNFDEPTYQDRETMTSNMSTIQQSYGACGSMNLSPSTVSDVDERDLIENSITVTSKEGKTGRNHDDPHQTCFTGDDEMDDLRNIYCRAVDFSEDERHAGDGENPLLHEPLRIDSIMLTRTDPNNSKPKNAIGIFPEEMLAGPVDALWTPVSTRRDLRNGHGNSLQQQNSSPGTTSAEPFCVTKKQLITTV